MKKILSAMLLLASTQALACPELQGKWDCRDFDNSKMSFSLDQNGREFLFQREGERLLVIADGQMREVDAEIGGKPVKLHTYAACEDKRLTYSSSVIENNNYRYVKAYNFSKTTQGLHVSLYQDLFPGNDIYIANCQKR